MPGKIFVTQDFLWIAYCILQHDIAGKACFISRPQKKESKAKKWPKPVLNAQIRNCVARFYFFFNALPLPDYNLSLRHIIMNKICCSTFWINKKFDSSCNKIFPVKTMISQKTSRVTDLYLTAFLKKQVPLTWFYVPYSKIFWLSLLNHLEINNHYVHLGVLGERKS